MKITEILKSKRAVLSFEVFPPKTDDKFDSVHSAVKEIASLKPDFMSVTYGAGGVTDGYTLKIAEEIMGAGVNSIAHLSCVLSDKETVKNNLIKLKNVGIENILALRGDIPANFSGKLYYRYASELVAEIKAFGGFCIGGACYPEGHPESKSLFSDIEHLKIKADSGLDFLTTQMFFDNDVFYSFLFKIREAGITVPVIAGIMPVTNAAQIKRICALSGTYLPARFKRIVERFGDNHAAMKQAGIAYATEQVIDLYANGVKAAHIYSMNKPDVAAEIKRNLSEII